MAMGSILNSFRRSSRSSRRGSDESSEEPRITRSADGKIKSSTRKNSKTDSGKGWPTSSLTDSAIPYLPHCNNSVADDHDVTEEIVSPMLSLSFDRQTSIPTSERKISLPNSKKASLASSQQRPMLQQHHRASDSAVPLAQDVHGVVRALQSDPQSSSPIDVTPSVEILPAAIVSHPVSPILRPSRSTNTLPPGWSCRGNEKHVSYQVSIGGQTTVVRRYVPKGRGQVWTGEHDEKHARAQPLSSFGSADSTTTWNASNDLSFSTDTTRPLLARRRQGIGLQPDVSSTDTRHSSAPTSPASMVSSGQSAGRLPSARGSEFSRVYYADTTARKSKSRLFAKK